MSTVQVSYTGKQQCMAVETRNDLPLVASVLAFTRTPITGLKDGLQTMRAPVFKAQTDQQTTDKN